jgi:hypothetical protein
MFNGNAQVMNHRVPDDLQSILDELDRTDQEASRLVSELDESQLNWRQDEGSWSVAQCLLHLAQLNSILTAAMRAGMRRASTNSVIPRTPIRPGWFGRWFINQMDAPPRRKLKSPKQGIPAEHKTGQEILKAFISAHDDLRSLIHEARDLDLNRIRFRNPFIGILRYTVGLGMLVIGAHDRRHLWQANQVCIAMKA